MIWETYMNFFKKNKKNKVILLTGPQGSGNHLWSKIFALHPEVGGWKELLDKSSPDNYFIRHFEEPNIDIWDNIDSITSDIMNGKQYHVISASLPVWNNDKFYIIPIDKLADKLESIDIDFQLLVIGRDRNILTQQQTRLRGGPTYGCVTQVLKRLKIAPFFVSTELLFLYRQSYIKSISQMLDIPIAYDDPRVDEILIDDTNEKYITYAENPYVDPIAKKAPTPEEVAAKYSRKKNARG
jgi:hypothetical protein